MDCPLCQSNIAVKQFHEYPRFTLLECTACELVFQASPAHVNEQSLVDEVYNAGWIQMREQFAHLTFQDHALFNTLLLEIFKPQKGKLLEIGSGTGEFLYTAKNAGWEATGIEPSVLSCEYAKQHYLLELLPTIWNEDLARSIESVDAIAFWHVLEHIAQPIEFLNQLADVLKDDGYLFFSIPNLRSFTNATYHIHSPLFTEVDHLYHYSMRSLSLLLEQTPFQAEAVFTRQLPNQLEQLLNYRTPESPLALAPKMALVTKLQGQGQGHEICCVARKK